MHWAEPVDCEWEEVRESERNKSSWSEARPWLRTLPLCWASVNWTFTNPGRADERESRGIVSERTPEERGYSSYWPSKIETLFEGWAQVTASWPPLLTKAAWTLWTNFRQADIFRGERGEGKEGRSAGDHQVAESPLAANPPTSSSWQLNLYWIQNQNQNQPNNPQGIRQESVQ